MTWSFWVDKINFLGFRDEIYCQICKQLTNNPSRNSRARGWILLSLCLGCFAPSEDVSRFTKVALPYSTVNFSVYKISHVLPAPRYGTCRLLWAEIAQNRFEWNTTPAAKSFRARGDDHMKARGGGGWATTRLKSIVISPRISIKPMWVGDDLLAQAGFLLIRRLFKATKLKKPLLVPISLMDGSTKTVFADSATTAQELCKSLAENVGLKDTFGFSLYISLFDKVCTWYQHRSPPLFINIEAN